MSGETKRPISRLYLSLVLITVIGCSTPLSTREKGALIGTGVGAATGAAVGSAVGHTGAGAVIGGALGLGTGALIGDSIQAREQERQKEVQQSKAQLERDREELERLRNRDDQYSTRDRNRRPPYFLPEERRIIREYFYRSSSRGLPPGLAKRGGNLPPGLQRQLQRNGTLPPGLQRRLEPMPVELERQLPGIPDIWVRVIVGGNILLLETGSNRILDIIENIAS